MASYADQLEEIADQIAGSEPTAAEQIRQIAWLLDCDAISASERRNM